MLRCGGQFPTLLAKSAKMGKICAQWRQFPRVCWPIELAETMKNMLLMLYPVLEVLGAMGVVWGAEMQGENFPKCGNISKMGAQQRQFWGVLRPTKYAECKENMLLTLYPMLGSLEARGGL